MKKGFVAITPNINFSLDYNGPEVDNYIDRLNDIIEEHNSVGIGVNWQKCFKYELDFLILRNTKLADDDYHVYPCFWGERLENHPYLEEHLNGKVMIHCKNEKNMEPGPDWFHHGQHLTSNFLKEVFKKKSLQDKLWGKTGASCHNEDDLRMACDLGLDYCLLSPIHHKLSKDHLISKGLGWKKFRDLVSEVKIPIYALGGMKLNDLETAQANGAAGIAGISMFDQSS